MTNPTVEVEESSLLFSRFNNTQRKRSIFRVCAFHRLKNVWRKIDVCLLISYLYAWKSCQQCMQWRSLICAFFLENYTNQIIKCEKFCTNLTLILNFLFHFYLLNFTQSQNKPKFTFININLCLGNACLRQDWIIRLDRQLAL